MKGELVNGKDVDGFLAPIKKHGKAQPFGKGFTKVKGTKKGTTHKYDVLFNKNGNYKYRGKVGVWYPNYFYFVSSDFKKREKVSIKITLMDWTRPNVPAQYKAAGENFGYTAFGTGKQVAVRSQGWGVDEFKVEFFANGKPLNKRFAQSWWDIDGGQNITFGQKTADKNISRYYYNGGEYGTWVSYQGHHTFAGSNIHLFPGRIGNVSYKDPEGAVGILGKGPSYIINYGRGSGSGDLSKKKNVSLSQLRLRSHSF